MVTEYKNLSIVEEEDETKEVGVLHIGEVFEEIKFGFEKREISTPLLYIGSEYIYSISIISSIIITCIDPN